MEEDLIIAGEISYDQKQDFTLVPQTTDEFEMLNDQVFLQLLACFEIKKQNSSNCYLKFGKEQKEEDFTETLDIFVQIFSENFMNNESELCAQQIENIEMETVIAKLPGMEILSENKREKKKHKKDKERKEKKQKVEKGSMKKKYAEEKYSDGEEEEDEPAPLSASKREIRDRPRKTYVEEDDSEDYA